MVIYNLCCDTCGFKAGSFTKEGGMYVTDNEGERIVCMHPLESWTVDDVLGKECSAALRAERIGRFHYWYCFACRQESIYDMERDKLGCRHCGSANGVRKRDLGGTPCPNCTTGKLEISDSGFVI